MNVILGLLAAGFRLVNRRVPWHRMPSFPAVLNLTSLRHDLRKRNLFGTQRPPGPDPLPGTDDLINNRSADGSHNDLTHPKMGAAGMRFGRNVPIDQTFGETEPQLLDPNPRLISKELLTRGEFKPVPHLNVAAAGWLQFMVHDWFSHGTNALSTDDRIPAPLQEPIRVPIPKGDSWHENPMIVHRTHPSPEDRMPEDEGKPAPFGWMPLKSTEAPRIGSYGCGASRRWSGMPPLRSRRGACCRTVSCTFRTDTCFSSR